MTVPPASNDAWVEFWYQVWERAYEDHHPIIALYALVRGLLRALLIDLHIREKRT